MSDIIKPKMDRAFALETIDAYPEDHPPTSSSDRFWFELAARFLAKDFLALERELAEARAHLTAVLQMGQEAALKRENADLRAELAKYEEVAQTEDKTLNAWMKRCYDAESSLAAARAAVEAARAVLGGAHEHADAVDWTTEQNIYVDRAAWSRYQQERRA